MQLINGQITAGVWQGDLLGAADSPPALQITHLGNPLPDVSVTHDKANGVWRITVPIPPALISDGVQTFVVSDEGGTALGTFAIICGDPLSNDLRAEISLLRSELELLQKAFRHHCSET